MVDAAARLRARAHRGGVDKFTNLLCQWDKYLAPAFARMIPVSAHSFMLVVGVIEIVAGIGVLLTPWTRVFAWIVGLWLIGIAVNLIAAGFYDIAVRDIVMAIVVLPGAADGRGPGRRADAPSQPRARALTRIY